MLRATDEPCFFFAIRAIMRRAMLHVNSHYGILEPECGEADRAAEGRRQVSSRGSSLRKMRTEIPRKSLSVSGTIPSVSPETSGIDPRRSPRSSGICRGSRAISPLDLGIESKMVFWTDRPLGDCERHWLRLMRWPIAGRCRTSKSRNSRRTQFTVNSLLFPWSHSFSPYP